MGMSGTTKKYAYEDVAGLHLPDANAGDDVYYAINLANLIKNEAETLDSVDWVIPNEITSSDSYINSDSSEAHIKLATPKAGHYRLRAEINSTDLTKTSKNRITIMLRVK